MNGGPAARRARAVVEGRVQGVFFRDATRRRAQDLGVAGWVANRADGRVEVVVEGDPGAVERLLAWLRVGPPQAWVDKVEVSLETPTGESGFRVR